MNIKELLEDIEILDLTVYQLSKKYKIVEKEIEEKLKELEKQGLIKIDYHDEEIEDMEIKEVMMNLDVTNKGKKLLNF